MKVSVSGTSTIRSDRFGPGDPASLVINANEVEVSNGAFIALNNFFEGPGGAYGRAAVIVKMTAGDGTVGWGQSVPVGRWSYETLGTAMIALRDYLAPTLIGLDPLDIPAAHAAMDKGLAPSRHLAGDSQSRERRRTFNHMRRNRNELP